MIEQAINLTGGISSGNTSCVFTRELNRELQQYFINYLYKYPCVIRQEYGQTSGRVRVRTEIGQ